MSDDLETQRIIGQLQATVDSQDKRLAAMEKKLDHVVSVLDGAKGSWKTIVAFGAIASGLTAIVMQAIHFFTGKN